MEKNAAALIEYIRAGNNCGMRAPFTADDYGFIRFFSNGWSINGLTARAGELGFTVESDPDGYSPASGYLAYVAIPR